MEGLNYFLNPTRTENKRIVISKRFVGGDGVGIEWELKPISAHENEMLIRKHTKIDEKTGENKLRELDYKYDFVASGVVYPLLAEEELQRGYGAIGEVGVLKKMLLAGEFMHLYECISRLSGFYDTVEEKINNVKNG